MNDFGSSSRSLQDMIENEHRRIAKHSADCFAPYKCQSCGCDKRGSLYNRGSVACVSHQGNPGHMASLKARELELLERSVLAQEALAAK